MRPTPTPRSPLLPRLFAVEFVLGGLWIAPFLFASDPGLSILGLLFVTAPIQLACMAVAAWRLWSRPVERPWAAIVLATPIALLVVPGWLRGAGDAPLLSEHGELLTHLLVATPAAVLVGFCLFAPRRVARWLPGFVVRSRALHVALVWLTALGWLVWIGFAVATLRATQRDTSGILFGAFVVYSLLALLGGLATALYAWVALFSTKDTRNDRLRWTQLALGVPALVLFCVGLWLRGFAGGPG